MTMLTKSAIAAAILAVMAGTAHAQSAGASRQIQVLPAPGQEQVAQAPQATQEAAQAPAEAPAQAPAQQVAPATNGNGNGIQPEAQAPKGAPVPPKFVAPKRPAFAEGYGHQSYGYASYGYAPKRYRNHCH